jgi:hypothetical protein
MAYKYTNSSGKTYTLHARETTLKSGNTRKIYFFAREEGKDAIDKVPEGYEVSETRNGLPVLKRSE